MLKFFAKYSFIGILNTIIHWSVFLFLVCFLQSNQAIANLIGFVIAVIFSFFANAKYTFNARATTVRFFIYTGFMGFLSLAVGAVADLQRINPLVTMLVFSVISLGLGFLFSKFIVFRKEIS